MKSTGFFAAMMAYSRPNMAVEQDKENIPSIVSAEIIRQGDKQSEIIRQMTTFEELVKHLATKEDVASTRADMERLRADLLQQVLTSERGQRAWIWGLYALIIISHFWK